MIWLTSSCPVGMELAARLIALGRFPLYISAAAGRREEVRRAVASCLGEDPAERLVLVAPYAPGEKAEELARVSEIWHLEPLGAEQPVELPLKGCDSSVTYRHFSIGPVLAGPKTPAVDAFGVFLQALDQTVTEVRARSPEHFERWALRTQIPAGLALPHASEAAATVVGFATGPAESHVVAAKPAADDFLAEAIGDAYDIELVFGADDASLSTVDRLFDSRLGAHRRHLLAAAHCDTGTLEAAAVEEIESCLEDWARHQAAAHQAERSRLAQFPPADSRRHLARPEGSEDGLDFHVFGETGPPVIIVNAIGMDLRYWSRLVDRLAADHRVVAWQLRGTDSDDRPATLEDHVADLAALVGAVSSAPVHLVGWCSGPKVCLRYAQAHPERVASLSFVAGTYRPFGDPAAEAEYQLKLEKVFELLERSPAMAATVRGTLADSVTSFTGGSPNGGEVGAEAEVLARVDPTLHEALIAPYQSNESTLTYAKQIRDFWRCQLDEESLAVRCPTLVVAGEFDQVASSRVARQFAAAMPAASFVEMPGATHYCMYDRPDEVTAMLRDLIGSVGESRLPG